MEPTRILLSAKIHRGWVTHTNTDYIGSVAIDRALLEKTGIWEYEQVLICDVNNGARWETYVLPAPYGSGIISVQGAGARLCQVGDCVIILAYQSSANPIKPKMILVDEKNRFVEYLGEDAADADVQRLLSYEEVEADD